MPPAVIPDQFIFSLLADDSDWNELIQEFVNEMPLRIESLLQAFDAADWDTLRRLAHQLKGAGGSYGFDPVTQSAARLEQALLNSQPEAETELRELIDVCRRLRGDGPMN